MIWMSILSIINQNSIFRHLATLWIIESEADASSIGGHWCRTAQPRTGCSVHDGACFPHPVIQEYANENSSSKTHSTANWKHVYPKKKDGPKCKRVKESRKRQTKEMAGAFSTLPKAKLQPHNQTNNTQNYTIYRRHMNSNICRTCVMCTVCHNNIFLNWVQGHRYKRYGTLNWRI